MGCKPSKKNRNITHNTTHNTTNGKITESSSEYNKQYACVKDNFESLGELQTKLRKKGFEASDLIIGIDFTSSNESQGGIGKLGPVYDNLNLHSLYPNPNPYKEVMEIACKCLEPYDKDNYIPAYGFGDSSTTDRAVFPFRVDPKTGQEMDSYKLEGVVEAYNLIIQQIHDKNIRMSGPTSFAPLIKKAIEIVKKENSYHILLIICDGVVTNKKETEKAIIEASNYPLSIICVGVGKGVYDEADPKHNKRDYDPWSIMKVFDDDLGGKGKFDNFQFVDWHKIKKESENLELGFALNALMEIPIQYSFIKKYILRK